jgi:crossover junction endodeoxyribonuclease RuvC
MNLNPVGLDLSLTSTGFSCGELIETISVSTKGPERLIAIRDRITELLALIENPCVCVEGYSFASRNSQAHSIGELGGVIRVALWEKGIPYVEIPPTTRAKFATGKGNAAKTEVMSAISARTGIVWSGKGADDMCDAWILEEMGLTTINRSRFDWPVVNLSALEKIDWDPLHQLVEEVGSHS